MTTKISIWLADLGSHDIYNAEKIATGFTKSQIAAALADKYAHGFRSDKSGRGRIFAECLEALQKAGQ